ncbi:hypothetical protein DOTSEDRAFT_54945 [Dothistroma septosporum NZE10]|uniref:YDG domain-containing protein n=1 Tax=Dothistroma septosporum (strain NZE10 / CBS 128990) TaxID=675120 RepID=N1PKL0_DOTSN|nr:hypothetical protein DOTSEDRAFT_54945 [Dothistroma septosporum NZE10]
MAENSSSSEKDLGAALKKATAAKAASLAAKRSKNPVVPVIEPEPEAMEEDEDSSDGPPDCLLYGHNRLIPGQWFANRASANASGAHEKIKSDVSPGPEGAYSIVVSYDEHNDLNEDIDGGDTILFAGNGAATWAKAKEVLSNAATKALDASIKTRNVVRVLRAAPKAGAGSGASPGKSSFAGSKGKNTGDKAMPELYPAKGLRYDGLYRVVSAMRSEINLSTNGRYDAYCLKRLPIEEHDSKKEKKAENQFVQPTHRECVRRAGQGFGGY